MMSTPHDDTAALIAFYGDPRRPDWESVNLVSVVPPWRMVLSWDTAHSISRFQAHGKCKLAFDAALALIWEKCDKDQDTVEAHGLHLFGGVYNFRPIRGSTRLSCHAFGAAIDINPDGNPLGARWNPDKMPQFVIDAFNSQGAYWGGNFRSRLDCQHFQFAHE